MESVTRNGEALDVEEHADEVLVKAGGPDQDICGGYESFWAEHLNNGKYRLVICISHT